MDQKPTGIYEPLTSLEYFGLTILFCVPIVGLVFLVFFTVRKKGNVNLMNFARSFWWLLILFAVIIGILFLTGVATDVLTKLGYIKEYSWR